MEPVPFCRPRNPRSTPLWKLSETLYERFRGEWEERFEVRFGFWRGLADEAVARYLDCGIPEMGFARLRCDSCRRERLLTFSCRTRQLCPSCGAKRGVIFWAFLREEVVEPVGHAQWVFTIPKILRSYFLRNRELIGASLPGRGGDGDVEKLADRFGILIDGSLVAVMTRRQLADRLAERGVLGLRINGYVRNLVERVRALSPQATLSGDELIAPGPASIRPAVIDLVRAAGVEILGLTAEESGLESFYRDLVRNGAAPS